MYGSSFFYRSIFHSPPFDAPIYLTTSDIAKSRITISKLKPIFLQFVFFDKVGFVLINAKIRSCLTVIYGVYLGCKEYLLHVSFSFYMSYSYLLLAVQQDRH